jgi:hypothetical protein
MAPSLKSADLPNLLLGLAWLGELDRRQIQRLWFVGKSESMVEKTLARLCKEGLIDKQSGSVRDEQRGVTLPLLARWSLTAAGHKQIKANKDYPPKPVIPREKRLFAHDARTTATVVRLIELGQRCGLSGIYVAYELPLSPRQRRPVCDALVVMQFGSTERPNFVPWTRIPPTSAEDDLHFAVEADNNTEPLAILGSKAETYRSLALNGDWARAWSEQHGPLPVPLWVAPTKGRAEAIQRAWKRAWPEGEWLITSDEGLERNELLNWRNDQERIIALGFNGLRPALAAAPTGSKHEHLSQAASHTDRPSSPATSPAPSTSPSAPGALAAPPTERENVPAPAAAPNSAASISNQAPPSTSVQLQAASTGPGDQTSSSVGKGAAQANRSRTTGRWFAASYRLLSWLGRASERLLGTVGWLLREGWDELWAGLSGAARACRDTDPWQALRNAAMTAAIVFGASVAFVVLANPALAGQVVSPGPLSPEQVAPTPSSLFPITINTPTQSCPHVWVNAEQVNLRPSPGTHEPPLRKLRLHERLAVLECSDVPADGYLWWHVVGEDRQEGWVATDWLELVR